MSRLLAAIRFLTILPIPGSWGTSEAALGASVPAFPVVGLMLGAAAAGAGFGLQQIGAPPLLAAMLLVVLLIGFSGGLHMDGLSDTFDGFLSSRRRERILEIMKDSRIGAMGVIGVVGVIGVKVCAVASLKPDRVWPALLLMPLAGRCVMVWHMAILPYVRESGLGTVFYKRRPSLAAVWALAVLFAVAWFVLRWDGVIAAGACVIVALVMALWCWRKIGGATGDTFGAACEIVEAAVPVALAIWPGVK